MYDVNIQELLPYPARSLVMAMTEVLTIDDSICDINSDSNSLSSLAVIEIRTSRKCRAQPKGY
jgi:hypothetical protein